MTCQDSVRKPRAVLSRGVPFEMGRTISPTRRAVSLVLIRLNPLRDEQGSVIRWYGTRTDIEDSKQAEARLTTLIDTIPAMVATTLPDGSADYVNQRWLEYYGLSLEDLKDWRWKIVVHPEDEPKVTEEWLSAVPRERRLRPSFACGGLMENIAGSLFARYRCETNREGSLSGIRQVTT